MESCPRGHMARHGRWLAVPPQSRNWGNSRRSLGRSWMYSNSSAYWGWSFLFTTRRSGESRLRPGLTPLSGIVVAARFLGDSDNPPRFVDMATANPTIGACTVCGQFSPLEREHVLAQWIPVSSAQYRTLRAT